MIRTGGGTFKPDEDRNCFFIAGAPQTAHRRYHLIAVNDARSDGQAREGIEDPIGRGSKLFLDSGIFNLTNNHMRATGCTMDQALALAPEQIFGFDELYARYVELVRRYEPQLWGYIELDQGGLVNKRRTRQRLHDEGLNPIPVYHPLNDGWDYFDELAESYDRICFGNIVQASVPVRIRLLTTMWERRRRYPHLWIHLLGFTANDWMLSIPSDSCDSSTWCGALRWGGPSTESSYMNRNVTGFLPPGFVYNQDIGRFEDGGWMNAAEVYAEQFDMLTDIWREIRDERAALGFDQWPAPLTQEGPVTPCNPS